MGFDLFKAVGGALSEAGTVAQRAAETAEQTAKTVVDTGIGAANDVGKCAAGAASEAGKCAHDAVEGAFCAAEQLGSSIASIFTPEKTVRQAVYTGEVKGNAHLIARKYIPVRRLTLDKNGEYEEGRKQALRLSSNGVELLVSSNTCASVMEVLKISNCYLYKYGSEGGGFPILRMVSGTLSGTLNGIAWGMLTDDPHGPLMGALLGLASGHRKSIPTEKWLLDVITYSETEYVFGVDGKEDGETLLEFLDTYMYISKES